MKLNSDICPWNHHMEHVTPIIKHNFRIKTRIYKWSFGWPIRDFRVFQFFIYMLPLNLLGLSKWFSEEMSALCYNVSCNFRTDDEKWQRRFDFGSKVTIVSIYCLPLALCRDVYYLTFKWQFMLSALCYRNSNYTCSNCCVTKYKHIMYKVED